MVKTHVSSKGQMTIRAKFRPRWKTVEVNWDGQLDGGAHVRPVPNIMSLWGSAQTGQPHDPKEKSKGRLAWATQSDGSKPGAVQRATFTVAGKLR